MAFWSEENLHCPVCHEIFQEPVLLSCSHSFCKACLQRWWTQKYLACPVCKTRSLQSDPPRNLALRNLCEDFLRERAERPSQGSVSLCSLHSEELRLFCLDHQQPVCVVCLHSETHKNHSFSPINEAARDYKEILQELLKPLQEKLELFKDIKGNFDQTEKDIEVQAQDTERQIKDNILMFQKFLQKEEQERIAEVRKEKQQKSQMIKEKMEALSREIAALSDTVRATEEVLRAEDLSFLQRYKTAAETVHCFPLNDPQPMPEALMDMDKHLNNLPFNILDRMTVEVTNTRAAQMQYPLLSLADSLSRLRAGDRWSFCGTESYNTSQSRVVSSKTSTLDPIKSATSVKRNSLALTYEPNYPRFVGHSTERPKPPQTLPPSPERRQLPLTPSPRGKTTADKHPVHYRSTFKINKK